MIDMPAPEKTMQSDEQDLCDVRVDAEGWAEIDAAGLAERCFDAFRNAYPHSDKPLSVLFSDDEAVRALNRDFRGRDKPTNVLSFPAGGGAPDAYPHLGDIVLALETCREEAAARGVRLADHAGHLLIHGMLHLIGYDHRDETAAARMEAEESVLLERVGLADPYREPAGDDDEQ